MYWTETFMTIAARPESIPITMLVITKKILSGKIKILHFSRRAINFLSKKLTLIEFLWILILGNYK